MDKELSEIYVFSVKFPEELKNEMLSRFRRYPDEMRQIAEDSHVGEVFFYVDHRRLPAFGESDATICSAIVYHTEDNITNADSAGVLDLIEIILERALEKGQQRNLSISHKQGFYPGSESEKAPLNRCK